MSPSRMASRIKVLEKRVAHLKYMISSVNTKCANILCNQRHYLKHRAPAVLHRQKQILASTTRFLKRLSAIKGLKSVSSSRTSDPRSILLVSSNEARKLRALTHVDFRKVINRLPRHSRGSSCILGYSSRRKLS